ncbi:MAG TPA: deoxyribodipyrimidine photo-lyase [Syntrophales bacterium]|nr:deoxyribodipyrimidine photo-lyase [Syntrophales bacterium]HOU77819.1 deoxyribodipyrimidine photo-lyase [Syntrophales bacterium]HPC32610.1 deoxyribodipyrimidine photo-lyase [Syntrophales bacterium]HQG34193.1 deoxyribodipyrimidine photo-lyase [Syntrophales bacterium]HQI35538.1 deoxyribodipyrimidine photo-lyase [Syntrophales bacterium]
MIPPERIQLLNRPPFPEGRRRLAPRYVLYWMQAAQRVRDNHALIFAVRRANELQLPLVVCFGLAAGFPEANLRHYVFMLQGLAEVKRLLNARGVRFALRRRTPPRAALDLAPAAALIVTDRGYLRIQKQWREEVAVHAPCPVLQVEAEVVVPLAAASRKEEYNAALLRRKLAPCLETYLRPLVETEVQIPSLNLALDIPGEIDFESRNVASPVPAPSGPRYPAPERADAPPRVAAPGDEFAALLSPLAIDGSVTPVASFGGGETEALNLLASFVNNRLACYREAHNDPAGAGASHLSPYLHFGQISPLTIALQVLNAGAVPREEKDAFLEELIVRRELSMNFVHYNPAYDAYEALPAWALKTLSRHAGDERPYRYLPAEMEEARTHDPYWNAAQKELLLTGKMSNYMRMYWGKKIIEWSATPRAAFHTALYLNNKYGLDGRDPNSFAGVAWCFGKHDRPWGEREIFGTVRYMNAAGLRRKFDIDKYVNKIKMLDDQIQAARYIRDAGGRRP